MGIGDFWAIVGSDIRIRFGVEIFVNVVNFLIAFLENHNTILQTKSHHEPHHF